MTALMFFMIVLMEGDSNFNLKIGVIMVDAMELMKVKLV